MKLNRPAMLAALSCLALAGYAGAASVVQMTPKSFDVVFTYPAIPLKLEMTKAQGTLRPGYLPLDTKLASVKLETTTGVNARLGIRWPPTPAQTLTLASDQRTVEISGTYNPVNKLYARFNAPYAATTVSINGGETYWTTYSRFNSVTFEIITPYFNQTISADRYVMTLEGAVYRD